MILQIDFWQLVGFGGVLFSGFAAIVVGAGKIIATQFQQRIDARFNALEKQRKDEADGITSLEREFLRFQADLPRHYVRRDDFVQAMGNLNTRIDNFALRMERALDNRKGEHL